MNEFRADLHCHSTCSDGSLDPEKLVQLATEKGLNALSITDHDSIEAYKTALTAAEKIGLEIVSGVEFSTVKDGHSIHLLGYSFSEKNPLIHSFCEEHSKRRAKRNRGILELLAKRNMPISEEELSEIANSLTSDLQKKTIGRPHIALAMMKKGFVQNVPEAFKKYVGEGCSCYVQGDYFSPEETIDLIHRANGYAIIAHPHLIKDSKTILKLLAMNFDGIECYYSKFSAANNERWLKIAKKRNWLITGGSDFHGDLKPTIPLGCSWVDEKHFLALKNRYKENKST